MHLARLKALGVLGTLALAGLAVSGCADDAECGNGKAEGLEECDDGNREDGDGCTNACTLPACGDNVVQAGEECDDGNLIPYDGCTATCRTEVCGDGILQLPREECDDGNRVPTDACTATCTIATCGDGVIWAGHEACDDGVDGSPDCSTDCRHTRCGDGVVQGSEECDDGNASDNDGCLTGCVAARCGDGILNQRPDGSMEGCDDGNDDDRDACTTACNAAICGDGIVRVGVELCDDGNAVETDDCTSKCAPPTCGDGEVQGTEHCDDGNDYDGDACLSTCVDASCGDGFVQVGVEECDDGNVSNHDACVTDATGACRVAACGDGFLQVGVEVCDDGNADDSDGCTSLCTSTSCGDGTVQTGETCDDGNASNGDACLNSCNPARCGDGFVHMGVELCDDGNYDDTDTCTTACTFPTCGDGLLSDGEQCDDGNASNSDGCLATCVTATCGDGFVRAGMEQCDDGNLNDHDGCLSSCMAAMCGDGFTWAGVEECDDGNDVATDGCAPGCVKSVCGDLITWEGVEDCDDGNFDNTDGCLVTCQALDLCEDFGVTGIDTPVACENSAPLTLTLTASGMGFLIVEGVLPTVSFDGNTNTNPTIDQANDCVPVYGAFVEVFSCDTLTFSVPGAPGLTQGDYEIVVTNPITQECEDSIVFSVGPVPVINDWDPKEACEDIGFQLRIVGTGLVLSSVVTLTNQDDGVVYTGTNPSIEAGTGDLLVDMPAMHAGDYDLKVSNGPGCEDEVLGALTVWPRPIIFFIDPPVIYNGVDITATLYVANINGGAVNSVETRRLTPLGGWQLLAHSYNPVTPSQVQATFPADMVPVDSPPVTFEVTLEDALGCPAVFNGQVDLTRQVTMSDFTVQPPFGWVNEQTGVSIVLDDPPTGTAFQEVPRIYLSPVGGGEATALTSVGYIDSTELTALVDAPGAGLAAGNYQVIVVNPDGTVGISSPPIPDGFTITTNPTPSVTGVAPGSVPEDGHTVYLFGENLDGTSVVLTCDDPALGQTGPFTGVNVTTIPEGLTFEVPAGIGQDAVCVVRTTNADGTYADFAAIVQLNPSENIPPGSMATQAMSVPRRAPVALIGSVTATSRFLYAIGGDNGSPASAYSSVEAIALTPFGELKGSFRTLPVPLPEGRTLAKGRSIGRFLYLVGGNTGSGAVNTGYRAEVLRPLDAPQLTDQISIALDSAGIGPGLWYYRVSAVMGPSDSDNPGGETLPSEALPILVPAWVPDNFQMTLRWTAVPGAGSYRVYRSPNPDDPLSSVALIGTTSAGNEAITTDDVLFLVDDMLPALAGTPRQVGDTGEWVPLPAMGAARSELGLALGKDPTNDDIKYLYAMGGADATDTAQGTYEYLTVTIQAGGSHQVAGSWTAGADTFPAKRNFSGYTVDAFVKPPPTFALNETWIFAGPAPGPVGVRDVYSGEVQAGGMLSNWWAPGPSLDRGGYGAVAVSSQVYMLGGNDIGITSNRKSGGVDAGGDLININNTPDDLALARELAGAVLGSGRIFLVGGNTAGGPTDSVESMVW